MADLSNWRSGNEPQSRGFRHEREGPCANLKQDEPTLGGRKAIALEASFQPKCAVTIKRCARGLALDDEPWSAEGGVNL